MIIAIDGPSGTGKGTTARGLAQALGFAYFDTGALYRALTWACMKREKPPEEVIEDFAFRIEDEQRYFVDGEEVTEQIRTPEVTARSPVIAAIPDVRHAMVKIQRAFAEGKDCVFEGRDMGTVVFPDAHVKIFLTARPEVRAHRRYLEWVQHNPDLTEEQVLADQARRDEIDTTRAHSPLRSADDALIFDTSDLTIDQVIAQLLEYIQ